MNGKTGNLPNFYMMQIPVQQRAVPIPREGQPLHPSYAGVLTDDRRVIRIKRPD
jgi:hypothetical protein